jgi:outer membrane protein assembly factor BamA
MKLILIVRAIFFSACAGLVLFGCTATSHLAKDDTFYGGAILKFKPQGKVGPRKEVQRDLETLLTPTPNTKVLGMRPGVWLYYRQRDEQKKKGLKAFIRRKFGQAPVLMRDVKPEGTVDLLEGQLQNEGYFGSEVQFRVKEKKKESKVIYTILIHPPYKLKNVKFPTPRDSVYARIIRSLKEKTLLKTGQRYDLARLQAEQKRIETEVENFGLFYFDDRYLIFEADSTVGEKQIDLELKLEKGIPARAREIYRIGELHVYPDYTLDSDTTVLQQHRIRIDSFNYYDVAKKFRAKIITNAINLRKDNIYTTEDHALTLSHLMDLGIFKFVNIQYSEIANDSGKLRTNIYLTPLKKKSIRGEFQTVSKSNSFAGPGLQLTYTDRNIFKGAELFQVRFNTSYQAQFSKRAGRLNSFELGSEASLTVPRFLTPIHIDYSAKKFLPKTDFRLGFNLQDRVNFFRLNSFNLSAGYTWRESEAKSHELYPIDVNFVQTGSESESFNELLQKNRFLQSSFEDQFIMGSRYSYTINTQLKPDLVSQFEERKLKTHSIFFNGNVQIAGNLVNAVQRQSQKNEDRPYTLFNSPYSQFVRGDVDFRHYWQLNQKNKLASRISLGTGYAYGNSETMPYIRQFSVGGSNSIRAFPARSVGPGTYSVLDDPLFKDSTLFIDQRGDIKLEANVELRFDIIKALKGAVFVDGGNIWLWREDTREGSGFGKDFYSEIAVGTGVGIRLDFNFFVLRFDTAFPLRKPNLERSQRWVFDDINFGSSGWRRDNLVYNIAIGYPF